MSMKDCGKPEQHQKKRIKLRSKFRQVPAGTVVEADVCPECGVFVADEQLGLPSHGSYMIPSALAEVVEE